MVTTAEALKQAKSLYKALAEADKAYFEKANPVMSDNDYDTLWFQLTELADKHPDVQVFIAKQGKPLGFTSLNVNHSYTRKVTHTQFIRSLDKVRVDSGDLGKRVIKLGELTKSDRFILEPKYDGAAVVGYKRDDIMTWVTRGGGLAGEDVTAKMNMIPGVEEASLNVPDSAVIRGEVVVKHAAANDDIDRSAASGALRALGDTNNDIELVFVAYDMLGSDEHTVPELDKLERLRSYGFITSRVIIVTGNVKELVDTADMALAKPYTMHDDLYFMIDGVVIKPLLKTAGGKPDQHHEYGQLAVKPLPESATAVINTVKLTEATSGKLTPVAVFDKPVMLSGQTIRQASLGSWSNMLNMGATPRALVDVTLANGVIPHVSKVLSKGSVFRQPRQSVIKGAHLFTTKPLKVTAVDTLATLRGLCKDYFKGFTNKALTSMCDNARIAETDNMLESMTKMGERAAKLAEAEQTHAVKREQELIKAVKSMFAHGYTADVAVKQLQVPGVNVKTLGREAKLNTLDDVYNLLQGLIWTRSESLDTVRQLPKYAGLSDKTARCLDEYIRNERFSNIRARVFECIQVAETA